MYKSINDLHKFVGLEKVKNVFLSSYSRIDKLEYFFHGKKSLFNDKISNLASNIALKIASKKSSEIYPILNAINYEKSDLYFEISDSQTKANASSINSLVLKIDRKLKVLSNTEVKKILKVTKSRLDIDLEEKILNYRNLINDYLKEVGKTNFFAAKFENMSTMGIEILSRRLEENYSSMKLKRTEWNVEYIHLYIDALFVLTKLRILFLSTNIDTSEYKDSSKNQLISIDDFYKYDLINKSLENDLRLMNSLDINVISDIWFDKNNIFPKDLSEIVPMSLLSSGELSMFLRLFYIFEEASNNSIILIDEPETHLHPKWIKKYIKNLMDLLENKNCHVIIATHSPLIISNVPHTSVIGLKKDLEGTRQINFIDKTLGKGYTEILEEIFDLDDKDEYDMKNEYEKIILESLKKNELSNALDAYSKMANSDEKYKLFLKIKEYKEQNGENYV